MTEITWRKKINNYSNETEPIQQTENHKPMNSNSKEDDIDKQVGWLMNEFSPKITHLFC